MTTRPVHGVIDLDLPGPVPTIHGIRADVVEALRGRTVLDETGCHLVGSFA